MQDLVQKIQAGDKKAFEQAFKELYPSLVSYGYQFTKDQSSSEEIVQEVFFKFWEKRNDLDITTSLKSYLFRSVHNTCLNQIKHEKVKLKYQEIQMHTRSELYKEDPVIYNELETKITASIELLPEQCQRIFKMSRFEGLKYKEIAYKLSLSVKTVEAQMGKALKIMRRELVEYLPIIYFIIQIGVILFSVV